MSLLGWVENKKNKTPDPPLWSLMIDIIFSPKDEAWGPEDGKMS